jgi:nucleotide-binding universal stress UspA family protein
MFRRILVTLDGSTLAEAALKPAFELAQKFGGDVILLRVVAPAEQAYSAGPFTVSPILEQYDRQYALAYLRRVHARWCGCGVPIRLEVGLGAAPSAIIAAATRRGASLIIMSTHGRSGLSRLIYGSVAEAVLRAAIVPVLIVPVRTAIAEAPEPSLARA